MISAKHITKQFGKLKALDDVSLELGSGHCVALIGPNGSGKTTFIKSVLGMVVPDRGDILFDGKSILRDWQYRSRIGYMPQIGRFPDNMTIAQVFDMMKDIRKDTAAGKLDEELVTGLGLDKLMNKRMSTLSGGMRQKVSAGLAFLFSSDVLFLDEPTAGLDPVSSEILKEKITRCKAEGKLIILTSHILSDLDDIVTEIVYMQDGKTVFHKSFQQLQEDTGQERLSKAIAFIMKSKAG
jgi:Cu-processing system ATP-binding protein